MKNNLKKHLKTILPGLALLCALFLSVPCCADGSVPGRETAEKLYPGWTLRRYLEFDQGAQASGVWSRLEEGMLQLRRAVFYADAGRKTECTDSLPVPLSESFLRRLQTEDFDSLVNVLSMGSTFLAPDAVDTRLVPIPGIVLENKVLKKDLICLMAAEDGRRVAVASPGDGEIWRVSLTGLLPDEVWMEAYDQDGGSLQLGNGRDFECEFRPDTAGEWKLAWAMSPQSRYEVTWSGVRGYDDDGCLIHGYGVLPGTDLEGLDWTRIPRTLDEALRALDDSGWAVVCVSDPEERAFLMDRPDRDADPVGCFYSGMPVRVLESSGGWLRVRIGTQQGMEGWMAEDCLAAGEETAQVREAFPLLWLREEYIGAVPFAFPDPGPSAVKLTGEEKVTGQWKSGDQLFLIVISEEGTVSFVPSDWYEDPDVDG